MTTQLENLARITRLLNTPESDHLSAIRAALDNDPTVDECDAMCGQVISEIRTVTEDADLYSLVVLAARLLDGPLSDPVRAELESVSLLLIACHRPPRPVNPSGLELFEQSFWRQLADALTDSLN